MPAEPITIRLPQRLPLVKFGNLEQCLLRYTIPFSVVVVALSYLSITINHGAVLEAIKYIQNDWIYFPRIHLHANLIVVRDSKIL